MNHPAVAPRLQMRWQALWRRAEALGDGSAALAALAARYAEPGRHYHTLDHVADCLDQLDAARDLAERFGEAEFALWFHDAVYDPRASDNEARSAALGDEVLAAAGIPADARGRIGAMILATTHAAAPPPGDPALVCDADLAILGATPDRYARYVRQVSAEYDWVPRPLFRHRRAAVLERLLERATVYATQPFREKYELAARRNLSAELAELRR